MSLIFASAIQRSLSASASSVAATIAVSFALIALTCPPSAAADDDSGERPGQIEKMRLPRPVTEPIDSNAPSSAAHPSKPTEPMETSGSGPGQDQTGEQKLDRQQARQYMVGLINIDRSTMRLQPVSLDEVASEAGQRHTDEMVANGYSGHWGLDGEKPPQRYTQGGGRDYDSENAWFSGFKEGGKAKPDENPQFTKRELEEAESAFFNEKPPLDGHRKNILNPNHNRVGICLSRATSTGYMYRMALTQEFVDHYGTYGELPYAANIGTHLVISGRLDPGVHFHDLTLYKEQPPKPMSIDELNATYSYEFPEKVAVFFPAPFRSSVPISVTSTQQGEEFSCEFDLDKTYGADALYSIGIWGKPAWSNSPILVSLRTIAVSKRPHDKRKPPADE